MAESSATHIITIPADTTDHPLDPSAAMQQHPLTEISESPGHLLLLKLWHREEHLTTLRTATFETRLDNAKREAFELSTIFLAFHGLSLTLLFTSAVANSDRCESWWVPSLVSLLTSVVLVCAVQVKVVAYWRVYRKLQRERGDGRALARCVQELRMKGASFDLSKEPQTAKRMKSSSVEVKWRPVAWLSENAVTICLLCFTGVVFPASKFILCG